MNETWRKKLACVTAAAMMVGMCAFATPARAAESNVFLGKTATASSSERPEKGTQPEKAVDGNETTKWCAAVTPTEQADPLSVTHWWQVDLGGLYDLSRIEFKLEDGKNGIVANNAVYKYKIAVSADNAALTDEDIVIDKSGNTEIIFGADESLEGIVTEPVRYVRIYLNCATAKNWPALMEVYGYGTKVPGSGLTLSFGEDSSVAQGDTFELPLKMGGLTTIDAPIYAMQAKVVFPDGIICTDVNAADNVAGTLTFHQPVGSNECSILYDADTQSGLPGTAETLLTLTCRVGASMVVGEVAVSLRDPIVLTYDAAPVEHDLMPVTITVTENEDPTPDPVLTGVSVTTAPAKTAYKVGDALDLTGLVIKATYNDDSERTIPLADFAAAGVTTAPVNGAVLVLSNSAVTISMGDQTATQTITVTENESPSQPGSSGSNSTTETEKLPDGSTVTTVIKSDGTKTETIKKPDGSTEKTITKRDGSVHYTASTADGIAAELKQDAANKSTAEVTIPTKAIGEDAVVTLPLPQVSANADSEKAPKVTVKLPKDQRTTIIVPTKNAGPGIVAVEVLPDGSERIIVTSVASEAGVSFLATGTTSVKIMDRTVSFEDVPADSWAHDAVTFAAARNLFQGTGAHTFVPGEKVTRGTLMTVLARADGQDTATGDSPDAVGMNWSKELGISDGTTPEAEVTRESLIVMLYRYAKAETNDVMTLDAFHDAGQVSSWAAAGMCWAVDEGILVGDGSGNLSPRSTASRAEVATLLQRYLTASASTMKGAIR